MKINYRFLSLSLALMLTNLVYASPPAQTHLRFCFEDELQISWTRPDGSGLTIELLKRVEEKLGERFEFIAKPWKRCQEEVSNGVLDGYFGAAFSEERQQFSVYPRLQNGKIDVDSALHVDQTRIFLRRDTAVTWDGQNLRHVNKSILVQRGYLIGNILSKQGYKIREVRTEHEGLRLLAAGEADVAILPGFEAQLLVQQDLQFKKLLQIHPLTYASLPLYLAISRHRYQQDAKRFDVIWNAIKSIRNSSSYQQEVEAIYARLRTEKSIHNVK